jgi:hypothetical protein
MAWYHPELYRRVLAYSEPSINQQWPYNPQRPTAPGNFHEHLIPQGSAQTDSHMDGGRRQGLIESHMNA